MNTVNTTVNTSALVRALKSLPIRFETILGVIFVYAAWSKIAEPPDFAHMIYNYKIMPTGLINLLAIYLPWIEMVAGLALIFGLLGRGSTALIAAMLVVFIVALSIDLARGIPVDCGCFELHPPDKSDAELFSEMRWTILRDVGMLAMAGVCLWFGRGQKAAPEVGE